MHRLLPQLYILAITAISAGCYHATIETGATPTAEVLEKSFASGWVYGLVPPSTFSTVSRCSNGPAKVETQVTFLNGLVRILTLGIYTPMAIKVTCAAESLGAKAAAGRPTMDPVAKPSATSATDTVSLAPGTPPSTKNR